MKFLSVPINDKLYNTEMQSVKKQTNWCKSRFSSFIKINMAYKQKG